MKTRETILGIIILAVFFLVIPGVGGYIDTSYTREGVIIDIEDGNLTIIEDTTGNVWEYESAEYEIGQTVKMSMFNGCTDNIIEDDEIVRIKVLTE